MEVSALKHPGLAGLRGPQPLLRLQSDEHLIELLRSGHHAAFETLVGRYQSRLLSFCRHMLASREDAEDVLQEVFTAAFNAILADEREINVRPWLYRIARNRCLNHLRRATAVGVDSMDIHFAENGQSTGEKALARENFRELIADVQQLPETQRTALLLREIDALSYEQIAEAMDQTIPGIKSLLVRARVALAEAAEGRRLTCEQVRLELGEVAEGLHRLSAPGRRHVKACERCREFKSLLHANNRALAALLPVGPLVALKQLLLVKLSGAHFAGGATAAAGSATAAGGATAGGLLTAGAGAIATKAAAGLAAAALVTAGAVEIPHGGGHKAVHHPVAAHPLAAPAPATAAPVFVAARPQPVSRGAAHRRARRHHRPLHKRAVTTLLAAVTPLKPPVAPKPVAKPPVTEVQSDTTVLPSPPPPQPQPQPQPQPTGSTGSTGSTGATGASGPAPSGDSGATGATGALSP